MGFQEEFSKRQDERSGDAADEVEDREIPGRQVTENKQIPDDESKSDSRGDPSSRKEEAGAPPALTLPPGHRPRGGGWTKRKMVDFLEALAETCSVADAAKTVYMSRSSAYRLRARLAGTPFDLAWEAAFENGLRQLSHAALDRAVNGVLQPVFHKGEQVGEKRVFNERLTWMMMTNALQIGRTPLAREHGLHEWDALLSRVEHGALDWDKPDPDAKDDAEAEANAKEYITNRSEYGSQWIYELDREDRKRGLGHE